MDVGVYRWRELVAREGRKSVDAAIDCGGLVRLRRGWYATSSAHQPTVGAVRSGGVLSCVSALDLHGVWVPAAATRRLHARSNLANSRTRETQFCRKYGGHVREASAVDDIPAALAHAVRCLDDEGIVVVCDSLLNLRLMTLDEIGAVLATGPKNLQALVTKIDGRAESGLETIVRLRLRAIGIKFRIQVRLRGIGRVDFLIGQRLIIEVDGIAFHTGPQHITDVKRDRVAIRGDYVVVRLTTSDVVEHWDEAEADILEIIRRRDHRRPRRHNLSTSPQPTPYTP